MRLKRCSSLDGNAVKLKAMEVSVSPRATVCVVSPWRARHWRRRRAEGAGERSASPIIIPDVYVRKLLLEF